MDEEREKEPNLVDISALDIFQILGFSINILSAKAWQYLGLQVDPKTQKVIKDLDKGRIAIDCVAFLIDKIAPSLGEDERTRLRALLTDLQINYIKQQETI